MVGRNLQAHPGLQGIAVLAPGRNELDLLDFGSVERYLRANSPDLIIHCAGTVGGIQANMREPVRFLLENLDMGRNLVWAAKNAEVKRLINLGSSCMYPRDAQNPLKEEMILRGELEPTNEGYALAKVTIARFCEYIGREDPGYQYKTLIPCNLYGPWDKFDPGHSHLIPAVIHKIYQAKIAGDEEVVIWGDGTARREFMYAPDLADCLVRAMQHFDSLPGVMNVGLGRDYTINEYYRTVAQVIGFEGEFVHDLDKPVGMKQKLVDVERQMGWGWQAKTSLLDGVAQTFEFYRRQMAPNG
ncbi:GDP-L-fucose synthase [Desulfuromonas versatilis]|uniref:GDP-L-fucose synthase n=2 Tax=Desulfuromonas versatilis TaxID=2802975 RepID=A0ABM8HXG2_9BACT|nr:GDP-L-fucose synthase [Desulfuromonas versatilis]